MGAHDLVIIGSGPAGEMAAALAVKEKLDVAVIERELVGGECPYWACMPSKALLRPGELAIEEARVPGVGTAALDVDAVLRRRDEVIHDLDDSSHRERLEKRGVTIYRGQGRLTGERRVTVDGRDGSIELEARRAVILAVGSGAALPPVPGLAEVAPWTNREATTAAQVPDSLIVLGGGAVGCELAQAWSSLGTSVTLVEARPQLIGAAEPFAADLLGASLTDQGVNVRLGQGAAEIGRDADGTFWLTLDSGEQLGADELLVAVGRRPHTEALGLECVELEPGATVDVDDQMRVAAGRGWLYAVGDVNGRSQVTHAGKYQAAVAIATIMNRTASARWDGPLTPQVVFCEPQVASVGYTLEQALEAGIAARAIDADPGRTPAASFVGRGGRSGVRIVVDETREVMIGATFVGPDVVEMLHAATLAIVAEVPMATLRHGIPVFPSRSEVWLTLLADWRP